MSTDHIRQRWQRAAAPRQAEFAAAQHALAELLCLMADLRGPGGCPWDREQSLASLRQYVREEAEEVCQAIDRILTLEAELRSSAGLPAAQPQSPLEHDGARTERKGLSIEHHPHHQDFAAENSASGAPLPEPDSTQQAELDRLYIALQGELGDLLLQPVFMGDILSAMGRGGLEISAQLIVQKLVRRHPHVYGNVKAEDSSEVLRNWEAIKQRESQLTEPAAS